MLVFYGFTNGMYRPNGLVLSPYVSIFHLRNQSTDFDEIWYLKKYVNSNARIL
jgi:hypothetical protein